MSAAKYKGLSFGEAIDSFLLYLAIERGHSENYQLLNRRLLGRLSTWLHAQGVPDPCSVQRDHLTDYLYNSKLRGLVAASLKQEVAVMKGFFRFPSCPSRRPRPGGRFSALLAPHVSIQIWSSLAP